MPGASILGASGPHLTAGERRLFRDADPWGFILFGRNIEAAEQVRALTAGMREIVGRDAPILIDQEGGPVQRLVPPLGRRWNAPLTAVQRAGDGAGRAIYLRYRVIAAELRALGIDVNCAPVADVARPVTHPFLRDRCFGEDAGAVSALAATAAEAHLQGGVLPVVKHMPGHGLARVDSHHDVPMVRANRPVLITTDFAAFRPLAHLPMGMTGHLVFTAVDPDRPATVSPKMIAVIRDEIGFDGLLLTDDLSMNALGGDLVKRAEDSRRAGCDVALYGDGLLLDPDALLRNMEAVASGAGTLSGRAAERSEAALGHRRTPEPFDMAAAEAELTALSGASVT